MVLLQKYRWNNKIVLCYCKAELGRCLGLFRANKSPRFYCPGCKYYREEVKDSE